MTAQTGSFCKREGKRELRDENYGIIYLILNISNIAAVY